MDWIAEHAAPIIGWIASLVALAFLGGKRLSKLESTDAKLQDTVSGLTALVTELGKAAAGVNGARIAGNEQAIQMHEVRLARLEEMRGAFDQRLVAIAEQLSALGADIKAMSHTLSSVEARCNVGFAPRRDHS